MKVSDTLKSLLGTIAPTIGTALGGPLGGVAAKVLAEKFVGKPDATDSEIEAAIVGATPEQLVRLKEIDKNFELEMKKLDVNFEEIAARDRDSARNREIQTKDWTPKAIGLFVIVFFFGYIGWVTFDPPENLEFVNLAVGWVGGVATTVVSYYFGSSSGSTQKNELIHKLQTSATKKP